MTTAIVYTLFLTVMYELLLKLHYVFPKPISFSIVTASSVYVVKGFLNNASNFDENKKNSLQLGFFQSTLFSWLKMWNKFIVSLSCQATQIPLL